MIGSENLVFVIYFNYYKNTLHQTYKAKTCVLLWKQISASIFQTIMDIQDRGTVRFQLLMRLFCAGEGKIKPVSFHKRRLCLRKISVVMSVTVCLPQSSSRWLQLSQPEPWFAVLFPSTYSSVFSPPFVHQELLGSFLEVRGWLQLHGVLLNDKETPLFLFQPGVIHTALFRNS